VQKWLKCALAVLALLVIIFATWLLTRPREPEYQGRSLSAWLDDYNKAGTWEKIEPTSAAIRAMGTNCLPFLLARIKHNPSRWTERLVVLLSKQRLLKIPFYGDDRYRFASIVALHVLGPQAAPVCPELLALTKEPPTWWTADMALLAIGTNAIPFLESACQNTNGPGAYAALMLALMKGAPPPHFTCGWVKARLNGKPIIVVGYAIRPETFAEIGNLLEHPSRAVRRASVEALSLYNGSRYTNALKSAVPLLVKACDDTNDAVRISAGTTLKLIDPEAAAKAGIK
jgi:hypothetical protein